MKLNLKPRDLIAMIVLLGLFTAKFLGMNGTIDASLALVLGYYFARREAIYDGKNK